MSAFREENLVSGPGWAAIVTPTSAEVHVDPTDDNLPDAVEAVVAPARRRFTTVEWAGVDEYGWDVYTIDYNGMAEQLAQVFSFPNPA